MSIVRKCVSVLGKGKQMYKITNLFRDKQNTWFSSRVYIVYTLGDTKF